MPHTAVVGGGVGEEENWVRALRAVQTPAAKMRFTQGDAHRTTSNAHCQHPSPHTATKVRHWQGHLQCLQLQFGHLAHELRALTVTGNRGPRGCCRGRSGGTHVWTHVWTVGRGRWHTPALRPMGPTRETAVGHYGQFVIVRHGVQVKAQLATGQAADLKVDAAGKLVGAMMTVRDPAGGADIAQTVAFSGEVESNGVKWPKRITVTQNGAPVYDLEIATFEAAPAHTPRPMTQSMQYEAGQNNAGDENAG